MVSVVFSSGWLQFGVSFLFIAGILLSDKRIGWSAVPFYEAVVESSFVYFEDLFAVHVPLFEQFFRAGVAVLVFLSAVCGYDAGGYSALLFHLLTLVAGFVYRVVPDKLAGYFVIGGFSEDVVVFSGDVQFTRSHTLVSPFLFVS